MDKEQLFQDHHRLLHHIARKSIGRLIQVGYQIEYEEVYAILCEVFLKVLTHWRSEDSKLSTYLTVACNNHITAMIRDKIRRGSMILESDLSQFNDEGEEFENNLFVDNGSHHILKDYEVIQALLVEAENMSPFAKILLEYTLNPPEFIEREFLAQEAKHEFSATVESEKRATRRVKSLNLNFVAKCLEKTATNPEAKKFIQRAIKEVQTAALRVVE